MNNKAIIVLLTLSLILASCSQPSQPEEAAPQPNSFPATEVPTTEPEPTAAEERVESSFYTNTGGTWVPIYSDEMTSPIFLPEEMLAGDMDAMQLVQYGYFASYDEESLILTAYIKVPPGEIYRMLDFQLSANQNVICLPETISETPITGLTFLPVNGSVSFPSGPGNQSFSDILTNLDENSYAVFVLDSAVDSAIINPINQLAMLCP